MKTIDRYILAKTLWPLVGAISVVLLALLLERMVRLLDFVVNEGGPIYIILRMLANLIPHYLGIALPAAFFVGVLTAAMRLSADSELDAIHAFGVSLHRLLAPIMALAVVLMVTSAIVIGFLQPYTRYAYRALVYLVTQTAWDAAVERGTFFTGFGDMTIVVDDVSDRGTRLSGVFVHEERPGQRNAITTSAAEGRIFRTAGDFRLVLSLERGVRVDAGGAEAGGAAVLTFDRFDLPLDLALGPEPFRDRGEMASELTMLELWRMRDRPPPGVTENHILAAFHGRLVRILSLLVLPLLAIPLGMAARRARRGFGFAAGLALLVSFHHVLQLGENLTNLGRTSPWLGLWLPFGVFAAISLLGFYAASARPGDNPLIVWAERVGQGLESLRAMLWRRQRIA